jgi:hypothetical protein
VPQHGVAADGDVEDAVRMARQAMAEHGRMPMRFERARTQLWLGQLQRRQRQKESAARTLREALAAFEEMGAAVWADRPPALCSRPLRMHLAFRFNRCWPRFATFAAALAVSRSYRKQETVYSANRDVA